MTGIAYADPNAPAPDLGLRPRPAGASGRHRGVPWAAVPLGISLGAHAVFFLAYWVPETSTFPGREWWLTQLAPLVSTGLSSAGEVVVPAQQVLSGIPGAVLLVAATVLWLLGRTRHWLGPLLMVGPAAGGLLVALVNGLGLVLAGRAGPSCLGLLLMVGWVAAAGGASVVGLSRPQIEAPTATWRSGLPVLVAYALVGPAPTAVGRALYGSPLRDAAAALASNTASLRLAALATPETVLLWFCGVLVGGAVWLGYQAWVNPRDRVGRRGRLAALLSVLVLVSVVGWPTSTAAAHRATTLRYASPAAPGHLGCGAQRLDQPAGVGSNPHPAVTAVVTGLSCRQVSIFRGYQQQASVSLGAAAAPVRASTPEDQLISARLVAAAYGDVLVVAQSTRLDGRPNQLSGLSIGRGTVVWQVGCSDQSYLRLRFAHVAGGDDATLGHLTRNESRPTVVVRCTDGAFGLDPATGSRYRTS